jgi:hypothetical protein
MQAAGFRMLVPGNDAALLRGAAQAACDRIRGAAPSAPGAAY